MKKLLYIIFGVMGALMFIQCSDWTEMEPKFTEPVNINGEDYYKALREYKKSDHPIVFFHEIYDLFFHFNRNRNEYEQPVERYSRFNGYHLSLGRGFQPD